MNRFFSIASTLLLLFVALASCERSDQGKEQAEIRALNKEYEASYLKKDPKAQASYWDENAIYSNPVTGVFLQGRDAIEKEFKNWFNQEDIGKLTFNVNEVETKKKDEVIEKGSYQIVFKDKDRPRIENAFRAVLIKRGNKWLFKDFRQINYDTTESNYSKLKDLEFLVGNWVDSDEDVTIETHTKWDEYQNFLMQRFVVKLYDQPVQEGFQVIGWDPNAKQVRSWIFDSEGGFGESRWYRKNDQWDARTTYTLPEGGSASATNIYTKIDADHYSWSSEGREVNGEFLPNIEKITIQRIKK